MSVGMAPSASMSMVYTVMAQTIGMVMHNGAETQHGMQQIASAATTQTCAKILENVAEAGDYEPVFDKAKSMVEAAATLLTTVGNNGKTALSGFEPGNS